MVEEGALLSRVRELSGVLFDAPYRLEVLAAIGRIERHEFTTAELQALVDEPLDSDSNVGRNLKKLQEAGLVGKIGGLWHRSETPLWAFANQWFQELTSTAESDSASR